MSSRSRGGVQTDLTSFDSNTDFSGRSVVDVHGEFDTDIRFPGWFSPPEWVEGFDEPVVEATGAGQKRMHRPDLDADEPRPGCRAATMSDGRDEDDQAEWQVKERRLVEAFRTPCGYCSWGETDE